MLSCGAKSLVWVGSACNIVGRSKFPGMVNLKNTDLVSNRKFTIINHDPVAW